MNPVQWLAEAGTEWKLEWLWTRDIRAAHKGEGKSKDKDQRRTTTRRQSVITLTGKVTADEIVRHSKEARTGRACMQRRKRLA